MTHSSVNVPGAPHLWPLYRLLPLPGTQGHGEGTAEGDICLQALVCGGADETLVLVPLASLCGPRVQTHPRALFPGKAIVRTPSPSLLVLQALPPLGSLSLPFQSGL